MYKMTKEELLNTLKNARRQVVKSTFSAKERSLSLTEEVVEEAILHAHNHTHDKTSVQE